MFARVELAVRPDLVDTMALETLRQIELTHPDIRKQIRWARFLEVFWFDVSISREEFIPVISAICWDKVSRWMFSGNLMPSAAGKAGSLVDLMEASPYRPGVFCGIERRFRSGVMDAQGKVLLEAIQIVLGRELNSSRVCSGGLLLIEGPQLGENALAAVARNVFSNELTETWTLVPEESLKKNDRFHQERVKYDLPRVNARESSLIESFSLTQMTDSEVSNLVEKKNLHLTTQEVLRLRNHLDDLSVREKRTLMGLTDLTDVELRVASQVTKHLKAYPKNIFQSSKKKLTPDWLKGSYHDGSAHCVFDEDTTVSLSVGVKSLSRDVEPQSVTQAAILKSQYFILARPQGAKPLFSGGALFTSEPTPFAEGLSHDLDDQAHPRRVLQSSFQGVQRVSQITGVPHINGAIWMDSEYEALPTYFAVTGGISYAHQNPGEGAIRVSPPQLGDDVVFIGSPIGKDGLASHPISTDLFTHKRILEFLSEAHAQGFVQKVMNCSVGGLGAGLALLAFELGGIQVNLSLIKTRQVGLKPNEILGSETQEKVLICVPQAQREQVQNLAQLRGLEACFFGKVSSSESLEIYWNERKVCHLDSTFLCEGLVEDSTLGPHSANQSSVVTHTSLPAISSLGSFPDLLNSTLLQLLGSACIASKESLIRRCDHEVQGTSVIKPLHSHLESNSRVSFGPNDAAVVRPKMNSDQGLALASGISPRLMKINPFLMAQSAFDETIRNLLCMGASFGIDSAPFGVVAGLCWSSQSESLGLYQEACRGLNDASQELGVPLLGAEVFWVKEPSHTLYLSGMSQVKDLKQIVTPQFKTAGDRIYVLGPADFGIQGSELERLTQAHGQSLGKPLWEVAKKIYSWLGGQFGSCYPRLQSIHDISDGGLLVAISECLLARGLGATLYFPEDKDPWEFGFGEGFHSFIVSVDKDDVSGVEQSWKEHEIPFLEIGRVESHGRLDYSSPIENKILSSVPVQQLKAAWIKEGYWQ
jgi:phosphoribosylformylglycinamidine (FGAM) synthase-like enzyme